MRILNIGSMNLDLVYKVDHIVRPGETEASASLETFLGGKGMNQSVALAKAGAEVWQAGMIGEDGQPFLDACREYGIHSEYIRKIPGKSGHAVIQLDQNAQNSILLYGGANRKLTEEYVDGVLEHFGAGDLLLLQNEVNLLPYIIDTAKKKGMVIALNPSPFEESLKEACLQNVDIFLVNEVEGEQLTGQTVPEKMLEKMKEMFPQAGVVLTLGPDGAYYQKGSTLIYQPAVKVKAVDTTAAGDTFTGYFLVGIAAGDGVEKALEQSAAAAALAVSRPGAVPSIPWRHEL